MLKSILNSIHTEKAINELQSLGIEVYKIGENGEKEFRKISDVLLDVSIKAKSTDQNFEQIFRDLSGGKFQVTKLSALIGDPNEYLRVLGNSINSAGFTDKQLSIQMDTIQRKAQALKASFEELLVTGGNESGFRNALKSILETLNQILKGLNNISPVVWSAIGTVTKFAAGFMVLRTAVNFAESAYALLKNTIVTTTAAQQALNVATMANPWGALARLIVLAATALGTYSYYAGQAVTEQEKAAQALDNSIQAKASELEMTKQQTSFMETLGNAYINLQQALVDVGDNEEKAAEIKKTMGTVSQELAQIVGQEAADRILASEDIMGAIVQEQQVHNDKAIQIQQDLDNLRATQVQLANDTVSMCNERIGAINQEAIAFDKAADAIGEALGRIDKMMFEYYRGKANFFTELANGIDQQGNVIPGDWYIGNYEQVGEDVSNQYREIANEANAAADAIKQNAIKYYADKGRAALGDLYKPGSYITTPYSTGTVGGIGTGAGIGTGGDTGSGRAGTGDSIQERRIQEREAQITKLWANHDVNHLLAKAKIQADQYEEALAKVQVQMDLTGETTDLDIKKFALMSGRISELTQITDKLIKKRDEYEQKAKDVIANHTEIADALNQQKLKWDDLTKEEKKDFISAYLGDTTDQKLAINYLEDVDKLTTKITENNKESTKITNELEKERKASQERLYNINMQKMNYNEQHDIFGLGYNATDTQKRIIQLKYAIQELAEAKQRLKEIEKSPHTEEEYQKQLVAVDELQNKVSELANYTKDKINEGLEGVTSSVLIQGNRLHQIWDDLWTALAEDALKALFKIQNNAPSLLGQILHLFGGSPVKSPSVPNVNVDYSSLIHARGGIANSPAIFGEDGEEVAIPVEKHTENSPALLKYAADKLGISMSTSVVPALKNPALASQPIVINRDSEHIQKLTEQNAMIAQQNQILLNVLNKIGESSGGTPQPIFVQQSMTPEEFANMYYQARNFNYIK